MEKKKNSQHYKQVFYGTSYPPVMGKIRRASSFSKQVKNQTYFNKIYI